MVTDTIEQSLEQMPGEVGALQLRVARSYRDSYFVVEEAENLMRIVAGPFPSAREALQTILGREL